MTHEINIDCFAGAGGASNGMSSALGAEPAIAINHWDVALGVHQLNHPDTHHVTEDVWAVDPVAAVAGRQVGVAWFSPDCTHFSRAKAGKPRANKIRGLAWSVVRWAAAVRPRSIVVENVPEFQHWGPIDSEGAPIRARRGQTFRAWVRRLQRLGYTVDWRVLAACDYGAPTTRRRLYVVARRGREVVQWPAQTHGPSRAKPWRTAAEVIDWTLPIPSIFERPRPLADATLARIARGIRRFVIEAAEPFVIRSPVATVAPTLIHVSNGERPGQAPRIYDLARPLGTVVAGGVKQGLVACYLARHFGGRGTVGSDLREPTRTVTARDHHALVAAFLTRYQGTLGTRTARDRNGPVAVSIAGEPHTIVDIGMRPLTPRELARAQGFPDSYVIERGACGRPVTRTDQVRLVGNSVCPPVARALVEANT